MCKLKSGIILKDRIYLGELDSHEEMLEELEIEDTKENAAHLFIRAELYPRDGNVFSDVDTWVFRVDQDILPDWYVEEYDKKRFIEAVKAWQKAHVFIDRDELDLKCKGRARYYIKDCANATVVAYGSATVKAYGSAAVKAYGSAAVDAHDRATVEAHDRATVVAWSGATILIPKHSSNKADNIILLENSTLKDCKTKTIYQSGDWQLVLLPEVQSK
ncbi:MAG: hypothetical protein RSA17_07395 [Ruthenibacterium sp.]